MLVSIRRRVGRALLRAYTSGVCWSDTSKDLIRSAGIAWRVADSLALRSFLGYELSQNTPDHTTISRTRRLIDVETHRSVFTWVLSVLAGEGLLKGETVAIDGTTLEANAALRSIVRRDSGESYEEFLRGLAQRVGNRNADAGATGETGPQARKEGFQR